jgi:D-methionine transport system ATP-binding protein
MISFKNVTKIYQSKKRLPIVALKEINLHIPRNTVMGIIGKSGAGKSSLIRCVNCLERPSTGQIWVDNQEVTALNTVQLRAARREIGLISQSFNLLSTRTVYQNIALPLYLLNFPKEEIQCRVNQLLDLTGLTNRLEAYPDQLSGGQKQRVGIARALASQPKILLCDEATSALDPQTTQTILKLLKNLQKKLHLTILLITHEIEVVKALCDQVALIEQGVLVEQAETYQFLTQPSTEAGQLFIASALTPLEE